MMCSAYISICFTVGWLYCLFGSFKFSQGQYMQSSTTNEGRTTNSYWSVYPTSHHTTTFSTPPNHYTKYTYPNPLESPVACGRKADIVGATVCDPNHSLSSAEVAELEATLTHIREQSPCECRSLCNEGYFPNTYIKGGIAIVPDISGPFYTFKQKEEATMYFAEYLREYGWNFGMACDNDFVIAVTLNGNKVSTSLGFLTEVKLSSECVAAIFDTHKDVFARRDFGNGLQALLIDYKKVLGGDTSPCPNTGEFAHIAIWSTLGVIAAFAVFLTCCCCVRWKKQLSHSNESRDHQNIQSTEMYDGDSVFGGYAGGIEEGGAYGTNDMESTHNDVTDVSPPSYTDSTATCQYQNTYMGKNTCNIFQSTDHTLPTYDQVVNNPGNSVISMYDDIPPPPTYDQVITNDVNDTTRTCDTTL